MNYRKGELGKTWFRTDRFFAIGVDWYVATREQRNLGPFKSKFAAEQGLVRYIIDMKNHRKPVIRGVKPATDIWKANNYI